MKKITIVTVVYNGAKHLEQAIRSIINQTYDNIEYIVIDGGSTDGTLDIIQHYEDHIAYWVSEPDNGIYDAMNKGIKKASGEFIGMLNADDWYEPEVIEKVAAKIDNLEDDVEDQVIYCDYYNYDEELSAGFKTKQTSEMKYWKGMTVSHQAMFIHRSIYEKLGVYSLDYCFASDYEFFLRLIKAGIRFKKLDFHGINFRMGGVSTTYMNRSIREVSRIIRMYFGVFSKEYPLFLLTNRLPSMLGNIRILLTKIIGQKTTNKLRKLWRRLKPRPEHKKIQ
ncbi:MAG: glycosyltransferase [Candidatus Aminicenantes bacterium]|nr:glycosyltransferase [Candidatus Aminicenantes bacterium]NIM77185.1 glycosyltransferase [Candidatus Aminicenantes bacterium]NIN16478.1 glycosyltransferase [Candidatus Aminicenantes bacterium]NIN40339.1 glycosyltransferase [Candidatus Aminicenantes bacterium]NIN83158.1 glycosyltransferase [Candidatus Aminicenantes bacterium]